VGDYIYRGDLLAHFNVLQFFVDTYEEHIDPHNHQNDDQEIVDEERHAGPGRPRHVRVQYKETHPKHHSHQQVIRPTGHRNLPNFVGRYFPRNDDPDICDFYNVSMLTLLKPWRNIARDLKREEESWSAAFQSFMASASERVKTVITGLQYFHKCQSKASETNNNLETRGEAEEHGWTHGDEDTTGDAGHHDEHDSESFDSNPDLMPIISKELVQQMLSEQLPLRERRHGETAVKIMRDVRIFNKNITETDWTLNSRPKPRNTNQSDIEHLQKWNHQMEKDVLNRNYVNTPVGAQIGDEPAVDLLDDQATSHGQGPQTPETGGIAILQPEHQIASVTPDLLNAEQCRAYDIVTTHLQNHLMGQKQPPLRMILYGEGGTGKSKVIQTITDVFVEAGELSEFIINMKSLKGYEY
jgi:hypothetical protein